MDIETYGGGSGFYRYDAGLDQAGAVGRFFTIGASYDFRPSVGRDRAHGIGPRTGADAPGQRWPPPSVYATVA